MLLKTAYGTGLRVSEAIRLKTSDIDSQRMTVRVEQGKRSKEIAEIMRLSPGTVNVHRKNIRKKLEIAHQKTNIQTMLSINS